MMLLANCHKARFRDHQLVLLRAISQGDLFAFNSRASVVKLPVPVESKSFLIYIEFAQNFAYEEPAFLLSPFQFTISSMLLSKPKIVSKR